MPSVLYELRTKGLRGAMSRATELVARYGLGSTRMCANIVSYVRLLEDFGARPTFPVTANVVVSHPDIFRELRDQCEFAVHGWVHDDYREIPSAVRLDHLAAARACFRSIGIERPGFRAPYLGADRHLISDVQRSGFAYDSSESVFWPVVERTDPVELALIAYGSRTRPEGAQPRLERGMPLFPTSLPDDELLIDRIGVRDPKQMADVWVRIVDLCLSHGVPCVLDFHPERLALWSKAMRTLLEWVSSKDPPVELLLMRELAERFARGERPRAVCVTGDIDVLELLDAVRRPAP